MALHRWSPMDCEDRWVLGMIAHGPAVLARSAGIVAGLRWVVASPGGLQLPVVLSARGVQAEAADRQTQRGLSGPPSSVGWSSSELSMVVTIDGRTGLAVPDSGGSSSGEDQYDLESEFTINELPRDNRLTITTSWPQAGLAESTVTLVLADLSEIDDRVIRLR